MPARDGMAAAAHRLQNTVGYLGAKPAAEATLRVEQIGRSGQLSAAEAALDDLQRQLGCLKEAVGEYRGDKA